MCELALCNGERGRVESRPSRASMNARTSGLPGPDAVADMQARLDALQGLWSSRRVRAELCEQLASGRHPIL